VSITVVAISFDAHGAGQLAHFWAQALHGTVNDGATTESASVSTGTDDQLGSVLLFHGVPEDKTVKNRMHFDLRADDLLAEADRLIGLGAKQIRSLADNDNGWIGFIDPEGNEFDLVAT
jgi:predicted enzyme related to lactoylglutathione lyase